MTTEILDPPSLFMDGSIGSPQIKIDLSDRQPKTLVELLHDGFYLLFMLRTRNSPKDAGLFRTSIQVMLTEFEKNARKLRISADDVHSAKYAFCALVDEIVLSSHFNIRDEWERQPLQLAFFGDQLAGENFFIKLEELRNKGPAHIQALEVFHLCLLLGFQGKYILEGPEKLTYLVSRLGEEIAHMKGKPTQFAGRWAIPDQIRHTLKNDIPIWVIASAFGVCALLAYIGFSWLLANQTHQTVYGYQNVVQLAPAAAHITVTLP
jgi:type VI secretion system protein ImpK